MPTRRPSPRLALAAALALSACGNDTDGGTGVGTPTFALVRVVNATGGNTSVRLHALGAPVGDAVAAGTAAGACVSVPTGQALSFRAEGSTSDLATISSPGLAANTRYEVVLYGVPGTALHGSPTGVVASVLADTALPTPPTNFTAIRWFNASSSTADVYLALPEAPLPGTLVSSALPPGRETNGGSAFGNYSSAVTEVRVYAPGVTTGSPRFITSVGRASFTIERDWTLYLMEGLALGTVNASFLVSPCPVS